MKIIYNENINFSDVWCDSDGTVIPQSDPLLSDRLRVARIRLEREEGGPYTPQAGEYDYTNISNWDLCYWIADHSLRHQQLEILFAAKGVDEDSRWAACSPDEQDAVAKHFLVSEAKRLERYTTAQDDTNFHLHKTEARKAREVRVNLVEDYAGKNILVQADRVDFMTSTDAFRKLYVDLGDTQLKDWMNKPATQGGFRDKTYFSEAILDYFNDVVVDGKY